MHDFFKEILGAMRMARTRIMLTGLSVATGIFMLVVLTGIGGGLKNGAITLCSNNYQVALILSGGETSLPYNGQEAGRRFLFDTDDFSPQSEIVRKAGQYIQCITMEVDRQVMVSVGTNQLRCTLRGLTPGYEPVVQTTAIKGRSLNEGDNSQQRKVCVISDQSANTLFPDGDAVGKWVTIGDMSFHVVGIYHSNLSIASNLYDVYVPISTAFKLYAPDNHPDHVNILLKDVNTQKHSEELQQLFTQELAKKHDVSPDDKTFLNITDNYKLLIVIINIVLGISLLVLVVGLATLVGGIVGMSNVMVVTVKERIRELGIRITLGSSYTSIYALIMTEALIISTVFGYLGLLLGVGVVRLIGYILSMVPESAFMSQISIPIYEIFGALALLVISGTLAGYIPVREALKMQLTQLLYHK